MSSPVDYDFSIDVTVKPEDLDELDHVNNTVYLQYAERVARAHAEDLGIGMERMESFGGSFVVRRHEIIYHLPANLGDRLTIATQLGPIRGVRAERFTGIFRGESLIVEAKTEWVWIALETRRAARFPAYVKDILSNKDNN